MQMFVLNESSGCAEGVGRTTSKRDKGFTLVELPTAVESYVAQYGNGSGSVTAGVANATPLIANKAKTNAADIDLKITAKSSASLRCGPPPWVERRRGSVHDQQKAKPGTKPGFAEHGTTCGD